MFIALIELWQVRHTFRPLSQNKMTEYPWSTFKAFLSFLFFSQCEPSVSEGSCRLQDVILQAKAKQERKSLKDQVPVKIKSHFTFASVSVNPKSHIYHKISQI